jgi:hypothetical protein
VWAQGCFSTAQAHISTGWSWPTSTPIASIAPFGDLRASSRGHGRRTCWRRCRRITRRSTSVGLTFVLHCLPGTMTEKLVAVDHLKPLMGEGATLFGATILGRGVEPNAAARALIDLYNAKGVFNNRADDVESLARGLETRFGRVEIEQHGLVALFNAR